MSEQLLVIVLFGLVEQSAADRSGSFLKGISHRVSVGRAFQEANFKSSVRRSSLARSRPLRREYDVGELVYYWRIRMIVARSQSLNLIILMGQLSCA